MPSGHAQAVCSEMIFIALYFQNYHWLYVIALAQTLLTLWQRYSYKCHTFKQLLIGSLLGIIIGYFFYVFVKLNFTKSSESSSFLIE
jgi:membrane-associated phospholipid phosphatase